VEGAPDRRTAPSWQQPEAYGRERRGAAMPRGRLDRGEGGADRRAWAHSVGWLRWLRGRPGRTVPAERFKPDLKSYPNSNGSKHFQTISNFDRLEKYISML
jgi:hypothetical protein